MSGVQRGWLFRIDPRELGISALFAAVVLFVAAMAMLSRNVSQIREGFADSERAEAVLRQLDQIHMKLVGTEMTVRGYALSGNPVFIRYHQDVHNKLVVAMISLSELVQSEPAMQADFAALIKRVDAHEALYAQLLAAGPSGHDKVANAISDPEKRRPREDALALLEQMDRKESQRHRDRSKAAEDKAGQTFGLAIGIAIFAFIAGTVGFAFTFFGRQQGLTPRRRW